jgi:peptidoglycan/xylan/chitin deacetylase (PgdA/CDA1 family)
MAILCYHSIDPAWESPLAITPQAFDRQCAWLARRRRVVDLSQAIRVVDSGGCLPRGMVALTFDDGFAALYEHALPILATHCLPATIFVVAETLTPAGRPVDWVKSWDNPPASPLPTLTVDQILEMQEAGITFGSHSYSHYDLTELGEAECERDLRQSRELLESRLGRPVPFLAFPRGRHNERVRRAAERAGFTHAFSLPEVPEPVSAYALPRVGVLPNLGAGMLGIKTSWWYPRLRTMPMYSGLRRVVRWTAGGEVHT